MEKLNFQLLHASAILFHSNADNLNLNDLPKFRHPNQFYVFFTQEAPPKAGYLQIWRYFPKNFFNLTMTYRLDSDILAPYDLFFEADSSDKNEPYSWDEVNSVVAKKNKTALQFVGNCYSDSGRETIMRKLSKLINLDKFGYCSGKECDCFVNGVS